MVTARFIVGTQTDSAILRVHDKVRANLDRIPVGIPEPMIVGRGIDDVAIVSLTLTPSEEAGNAVSANDLTRVARELRTELSKIDNVGLTYLVGDTDESSALRPIRSGSRSTASRCSSSPARSAVPTGPFRRAK
jgi:multidrug efflux pump subunit AcrB